MHVRKMLVKLPDYVYSGIGTLIFFAVFVFLIMYADAPFAFNATVLAVTPGSICTPAFMLQWWTNFSFAKPYW